MLHLCNKYINHYLHQVSSAENKLKKWRIKISNLYKDYNELLFFSVSKILSIHEILRNFFSVDKVLQEIGFLFKNDDEAMNSLRVAVEVCVNAVYYLSSSTCEYKDILHNIN